MYGRVVIVSALFLLTPSAVAQDYLIPFSPSGSAVTPIYELTFNSDEGDSDCTNHGASSTDTDAFDCSCTIGDGCNTREGDGAFRAKYDVDPLETIWQDKLGVGGLDDAWITFWFKGSYINVPTYDVIRFWATGDAEIGGGYRIQLDNSAARKWVVVCDGTSTEWSTAFPFNSIWYFYWVHLDLVNGDIEIWRDTATGAADHTCSSGGGGDSGWASWRSQTGPVLGATYYWGLDHLRIYDTDPR